MSYISWEGDVCSAYPRMPRHTGDHVPNATPERGNMPERNGQYERLTGISDDGTYVFNSVRESSVWYYTHDKMNGHLGEIRGDVNEVVEVILRLYPDIYQIEYRSDNRIRLVTPSTIQPRVLSKLVAEELTK